MTRRWTLILALTLLAAPARAADPAAPRLVTPFAAYSMAAADCATLAGNPQAGIDTRYVRFLWLLNGPPKERQELYWTVSWAVNSLNTTSQLIVPPAALPNRADPVLVRVNLHDYGISPAAWDAFVQAGSGLVPIPESCFSTQLIKDYEEPNTPAAYVAATGWEVEYRDHRWYYTEGEYAGRQCYEGRVTKRPASPGKTVHKVTVNPAPAVTIPDGGAATVSLTTLTHSKTPVARADWFLVYALQAPQYYNLLGLHVTPGAKFTDPLGGSDEGDFEKLAGIDEVVAGKARIQEVANTRIVTLHNRIIDRIPTANAAGGSAAWKSIDTDQGVNDQDYLLHFQDFFAGRKHSKDGRTGNNGKLKFAAQEYIITVPNGLQAGALTNDKGRLLNVAVQTVANDTHSLFAKRLSDSNVVNFVRCACCHDHVGGLQPIEHEVRALSADDSRLLIAEAQKRYKVDATAATRIVNAYGADIDSILKMDMSRYAVAVAAATGGHTPQENAEILERTVVNYLADPVDLAVAEREMGVPQAEILAAIRGATGLSYGLVGLGKAKPKPIARLAFENQEGPQLATLLAQTGRFGVPPGRLPGGNGRGKSGKMAGPQDRGDKSKGDQP